MYYVTVLINKLNRKLISLVLSDVVLLVLALIFASSLDGYSISQIFKVKGGGVALIIAFQVILFIRLGLYRAILRYASVDFLITVLKAVSIATGGLIIGFYLAQVNFTSKTLFVYWVLTIFLIGGSRFIVRYYFELVQRYHKGDNVLIYGAGDLGSLALRQLKLNKAVAYSPVGFIDDDPAKTGKVMHGIYVLGTSNDIEEIIDRKHVVDIVVAIADIDGDKLREVVKRCRNKNIACRIIPGYSRLVEIEHDLRSIELADLMRRTPRDLDKAAIREHLKDKRIMVTGAAGSIGKELVKQCFEYDPEIVLALDRSECGLYQLQEELKTKRIEYVLADTADISRIDKIFDQKKPDIVFHAAAYKHVPLLESNPIEAIKNNISSTRNLCVLADKYKVNSFVMISTDKAVKPSSIMGATKRVCELIVQNFIGSGSTKFVSVRFGNVLGSSGSVVPKFIEQIRGGGPVTVTHPEATRYFMLIDEAVQLVLQAATIGKGGEIFILDMGKPVRILDMAEDLIYLMGRQPHKDIKIEFNGLRPGEKIYEELFSEEIEFKTKFKGITVGRPKVVDWQWLESNIRDMLEKCSNSTVNSAIAIMKTLVPEGTFREEIVKYGYEKIRAE